MQEHQSISLAVVVPDKSRAYSKALSSISVKDSSAAFKSFVEKKTIVSKVNKTIEF